MTTRRRRILIAKPGLDGHDRGAKVVSFALRDAGCEVIYLGLRSTPTEMMTVALEEDVDVIGASILSGAHLPIASDLIAERSLHRLEHVPVVVGGIVPPRDVERLLEMGVDEVFPAGTAIADVVKRITALADSRQERP
ncbi:MAG: methylmalonyl-CoA mutase [Acidimicrobiaceae bacterium]|nr:methylmalonyl-CoA mutase [Acidimicrobiaceae bacterium]MYG98393.1 methylmalonyl-CoA mutase [Acidimicrobiaceae bacterium]MYL04704.1 methylmalonyl-CoA mutase [Acidimicrobiaceae bacterium]